MIIKLSRAVLLLLAFMAAGYLAPANAQTVSASISGGAATKGKAARLNVVLSIPKGLHVNSNRPNSEYAIPTTVRVNARGASVGAVSYPRGRNRKFEFSQDTINVYEGRAMVIVPITVPANYRGNSIKADVTVRFQACTNEVCYPPKSQTVSVTARVL